jgi:hypothetical protein
LSIIKSSFQERQDSRFQETRQTENPLSRVSARLETSLFYPRSVPAAIDYFAVGAVGGVEETDCLADIGHGLRNRCLIGVNAKLLKHGYEVVVQLLTSFSKCGWQVVLGNHGIVVFQHKLFFGR